MWDPCGGAKRGLCCLCYERGSVSVKWRVKAKKGGERNEPARQSERKAALNESEGGVSAPPYRIVDQPSDSALPARPTTQLAVISSVTRENADRLRRPTR
jgi:hypothetical protein